MGNKTKWVDRQGLKSMLLLGATVSFQCMCVELLAQCLETNIVSSKTMLAVGIINSITSDIIKYEYHILFPQCSQSFI